MFVKEIELVYEFSYTYKHRLFHFIIVDHLKNVSNLDTFLIDC